MNVESQCGMIDTTVSFKEHYLTKTIICVITHHTCIGTSIILSVIFYLYNNLPMMR